MSDSNDKPAQDIARFRYEEAIEALERIVDRVESGEIGLEESLVEYERGMKLIRHCQDILDRSQARIAELTQDAQGRLAIRRGQATDPALADEPGPSDEDGQPRV